jgi:predicted nuclease with TOPRIM domain
MSKIKLSKEELQKLQELQSEGNQLIFSLGQLETQKMSIFSQIEKIQKERDILGAELQEKYGDGNINIETGEFTKPE